MDGGFVIRPKGTQPVDHPTSGRSREGSQLDVTGRASLAHDTTRSGQRPTVAPPVGALRWKRTVPTGRVSTYDEDLRTALCTFVRILVSRGI